MAEAEMDHWDYDDEDANDHGGWAEVEPVLWRLKPKGSTTVAPQSAVQGARKAATLNSRVDAAVAKELEKREKEKEEEKKKASAKAEEAGENCGDKYYNPSQLRVITMATREVLADDVEMRDLEDLTEALCLAHESR